FHVSGARFLVYRFDGDADDAAHDAEEIVQRDAPARGHIDGLAYHGRRFARSKNPVYNVCHIGEIARLLAVAVDHWLAPGQQRRREERDDTRIRRSGILSRTENIEVPGRHGLEPE